MIRYDIFLNTPRENKDIGKTWLIKGFYENTKMPSVSYCRMLNTAADTGFHTKGYMKVQKGQKIIIIIIHIPSNSLGDSQEGEKGI